MAEYIVFISHSGVDTWVARQISHHCQRAGAKTFLDEADIQIGIDFEERIKTALDAATELLVLVTPWALERPYVWIEIGVSWDRSIPLVPVLHGITAADLQADNRVPVLLKRRNVIDINRLDRYFEELKQRVEANQPTTKPA